MRILVIGGGGREHAIIWKLKQSPEVTKIYCAPGNAGIGKLAERVPISATDTKNLLEFAVKNKIDLTVVGMDEPLVKGIVDEFRDAGLRIFGPDKKAAEIEGSKSYAKGFMERHGIPTAGYKSVNSYEEGLNYIREQNIYPIVVKADGLALGKGVTICENFAQAEQALRQAMIEKKFGESGESVVIEEYLTGPEVPVLAFSDGKTIVPMVSAQDHKRAYDGDKGPNTGGMGAFSPSKVYTEKISKECLEKIYIPTVKGLQEEGREFKGIIFFGLMLTEAGPKVIEYNCRFGDPETQVVLPRLKSDLLEILEACIDGNLEKLSINWDNNAAACVIIASGGYPESYEKGFEINGLGHFEQDSDIEIFHAGTEESSGKIITSGGRVLGVTGIEKNLEEALNKSYRAVERISFKNSMYRHDIGRK